MKMLPRTEGEWFRSVFSVLVFLLLLFTGLALASHYVADCSWAKRDYPNVRLYDALSGYTGGYSQIAAGLLLLFSLAAAIRGQWQFVRWASMWIGAWVALLLLLAPALARAREKPVIYLYPETEQAVNVKLSYDGRMLHAYPDYPPDGWQVIAKPSGEVVNTQTGRSHYCLFWEGDDNHEYALDEGFVVAGKDTAYFLESTLAKLGLSDREANEFIIYWLPRMEKNAFNFVCFPSEEYSQHARLQITPVPDTLIRVFMVFKPVARPVDIRPPTIKSITRRGFTAVEWGGTELD